MGPSPVVQVRNTEGVVCLDHDSDLHVTREDIYDREKAYLNSLTRSEVNQKDSGVSNYYVPVYPNDSSTVPTMILWFFDSRGGYVHLKAELSPIVRIADTLVEKEITIPGWVIYVSGRLGGQQCRVLVCADQ